MPTGRRRRRSRWHTRRARRFAARGARGEPRWVELKEAEKIPGQGDAEATRIYGQAYTKNPRFYKLLRTLEAYKKVLDDKTTAVLSSDSELLKVLTRGEEGAKGARSSTNPG